MKSVYNILNDYGALGVKALKDDVSKVSATHKTERSIRYEVEGNESVDRLIIYARAYFSAIETGRGPRKSTQYQEYDKSLLEYMEARGLVSGLTQKQKESKAKSLAWYINKHGDKTYREGGRIVYSKTMDKLVKELTEAIKKDFKDFYVREIRNAFKTA